MKKILPIAMLALAATAVSCSNDNDNGLKNPTKDAISFSRPYVINSVKEKTGSSNIDFNSFYVWGFVNSPDSYIFDKNTVELNGENWVVDKTEYWYLGQKYYFTAIAPIQDNITFTKVTAPASDSTYVGGGTIAFDNDGHTDLVYAFQAVRHDAEGSITKVGLTFQHLLSRVMFSFKNEVSDATKLVIKDLTLMGTNKSGEINMNSATKSWVPTGTFDISGIETDGKISRDSVKTSQSRYIIPTNEKQAYQISFNVDVYNGTQLVKTYEFTDEYAVTLPAVKFDMGNSYNFSATFNHQNLNPEGALKPIEFTVNSVNNWNDTIPSIVTPIPTPGN